MAQGCDEALRVPPTPALLVMVPVTLGESLTQEVVEPVRARGVPVTSGVEDCVLDRLPDCVEEPEAHCVALFVGVPVEVGLPATLALALVVPLKVGLAVAQALALTEPVGAAAVGEAHALPVGAGVCEGEAETLDKQNEAHYCFLRWDRG